MNKFLFLVTLLSVWASAQKQVHIQYLNVRSPVANVYEDLYTDGKRVISKQDGNIMWTDSSFNKNNKKGQDFYFISMIDTAAKDRNFFFTTFVKDDADDYYFVHDKVPHMEWVIDKETTKKYLVTTVLKRLLISGAHLSPPFLLKKYRIPLVLLNFSVFRELFLMFGQMVKITTYGKRLRLISTIPQRSIIIPNSQAILKLKCRIL